MPDDVGDQPFPGGEKPEKSRDHGAADDEFASVVFDDEFVRAAAIHEPTAAERILAAAQSRAEAESPPPYEESFGYGPGADSEYRGELDGYGDLDDDEGRLDRSDYTEYDDGYPDEPDEARPSVAYPGYDPYECSAGSPRPYRGHARWQRPVAWVLAVVMGVGVVALAVSAVYRGAVSQRQTPAPPPATSRVGVPGQTGTTIPSASLGRVEVSTSLPRTATP